MAAKKKGAQVGKLDLIGKMLPKIGLTALRQLLEKTWPDGKFEKRGSDVIRMCCPIHQENTPSCDLNIRTGSIHCFGCGYSTYSLLDFLKRGKGWSVKQALECIRQVSDAKFVSDAAAKELTEIGIYDDAMKVMYEVFNLHLRNLIGYSYTDPEHRTTRKDDDPYNQATLDAAANTLRWLFEVRKLSPDLVEHMPYGVVPNGFLFDILLVEVLDKEVSFRERRNMSYADKEWREAVFNKAKEIMKLIESSHVHSVAFFTGKGLAQFFRMKLRRPFEDKSTGIYVVPGRIPDEPLGYFGLCLPRHFTRGVSDSGQYSVYVVEGEFDALRYMEGVVQKDIAGALFIASGGTANEMDALVEAAIARANLISDEPLNGGGKEYVQTRLSTALDLPMRVFNRWDVITREHPSVKDPDDYVNAVGFDVAYAMFTNIHHYVAPADWAYEQVQDDMRRAESSGEDTGLRATLARIEKYGLCIRHTAEQTQFVEMAAKATNIPAGEIRTLLASGRNDERAFIMAIANRIQQDFHPLYLKDGIRSPVLVTHHKEIRRTVEMSLADGESIGYGVAQFSGSIYEWMRDKIGLPPFLNPAIDAEVPNTTPEKTVLPDILAYLKLAMQHVIQGVPSRSGCIELGQGIHLIEDANIGEKKLIFNNKDRVYLGRFAPNHQMLWEELAGPSDGVYLFRPSTKAWSVEVNSAADLNAGNDITLEQCRDSARKLVDIIRLGWNLLRQQEDSLLLGWLLPAMALSFCWPKKIIMHFLGQSHTGKSALSSVFGFKGDPRLRMLEAALSVDSFTEASFAQGLSRSSLTGCFDEFEETQDGTRQSFATAATIKMMRNVINEGGVNISRGTTAGKTVEYEINSCMILASILPANQSQDDNRRLAIETRRAEGHGDSAARIFSRYTVAELREIRRNFTLGLPKFAPLFLEHYHTVTAKIQTGDLVPFEVPPRFYNNLVPAMAMMSMCGVAWEVEYEMICRSRRNQVKASYGDTNASVMFERVFRTAGIQLSIADRNGLQGRYMARPTDLMKDPLSIQQLNQSHCGLYIMPNGDAVVDCPGIQGPTGLLHMWMEYRSMPYRNIKHTLDQHPTAVLPADYEKRGIPAFVRSTGGIYNPNTISVLSIAEMIKEIQEAAGIAMQAEQEQRYPRTAGLKVVGAQETTTEKDSSNDEPSDPSDDNNI